MFLSEWREFPSAPCLAEKKKLDDSSRLDVLKSHTSLTCFRDCFLPGRAKDLSAPWYSINTFLLIFKFCHPALYLLAHCVAHALQQV